MRSWDKTWDDDTLLRYSGYDQLGEDPERDPENS